MQSSKKLISVLIALFFSIALSLIAEEATTSHISVTGTAEIKTEPDTMHWNITISNKHASVQELGALHETNTTEILDFIRNAGIEAKDIRTSRIQLSENWVYKNRKNVKEGYIANTTVQFSSKDFQLYKHLWIGLTEFETVSIGGVGFDISNRIDLQNQARIQAAGAAMTKADELCEALNSVRQEALSIQENPQSNSYDVNPMRNVMLAAPKMEASQGGTAAIAPGQISITSKIWVTFRIMPK